MRGSIFESLPLTLALASHRDYLVHKQNLKHVKSSLNSSMDAMVQVMSRKGKRSKERKKEEGDYLREKIRDIERGKYLSVGKANLTENREKIKISPSHKIMKIQIQ